MKNSKKSNQPPIQTLKNDFTDAQCLILKDTEKKII